VVKLKRGDVASIEQIRQASQSVRDYYGSRGYIDTLVRYDLDAKPSRGVVDVRFDVQEGELAYIRDIRIRGNTRTQDKVIRRELAVVPGDIFNEVRVRISERRLWNLGFFSFVNSVPEPTAEQDQYDLTFEVEEQKTGQFIVGAGFSSVDDVVGFVELSQGNFDLFGWPHLTGGGQKLKLRSQFGTERTDVELSFVEPWLFNRKLSLGVDLYRHDSRFLSDDYDQRNTGGSVSLARALTRSIRGSLKYAFEEIEVYDLSDDASDRIREEEGSRTKSSMTLGLLRDTRDSVFVPTRGNRTSLSATLAGGPLGAETDLYELEARSSQYIPLWFGHVLNIKGWAAVVEEHGDADRVPIFDRLFLGGARTIRGFRYRDVGPRDTEGEPIGGRTAAYGTAEYSIPLGKTIRFATFYDVGMVWEEAYEMEGDYNSSYGIGLRFDIPGFPLRLDYAWPLETDEYTIIEVGTGLEQTKTNDQPSGRFSFLLGYVF
jgi:outer membrane protein insertion porin family